MSTAHAQNGGLCTADVVAIARRWVQKHFWRCLYQGFWGHSSRVEFSKAKATERVAVLQSKCRPDKDWKSSRQGAYPGASCDLAGAAGRGQRALEALFRRLCLWRGRRRWRRRRRRPSCCCRRRRRGSRCLRRISGERLCGVLRSPGGRDFRRLAP